MVGAPYLWDQAVRDGSIKAFCFKLKLLKTRELRAAKVLMYPVELRPNLLVPSSGLLRLSFAMVA